MQDALINFLNFIADNLVSPIVNALTDTAFFDDLKLLIQSLLNGFLRLWNNDNILIDFDSVGQVSLNNVFGSIIGLLVIIFILKITISIFNVIFNTIRGNFK